MENPKYRANAKNEGIIPLIYDQRTKTVPIGCGYCIECRKKKAREWQIRLTEDIKTNTNGKFITLTFSNESIQELIKEQIIKTVKWYDEQGKKHTELRKFYINELEGYDQDNAIATIAMRRFNERWRKQFKKAIRHWTVTELGHEGTENIHIHGIIWTDQPYQTIREKWQYGYIWPRPEKENNTWVNEVTINYNIKYVHKIDERHKTYKPIVLTSPGIGENYITTYNAKNNKYKENNTDETYRSRTGHKMSLPIYWRNKLYTEEEKEKLWIEKLNKEIRWIGKTKIDISKGEENYYKALITAQKENNQLGYINHKNNWTQLEYEKQRRKMMQQKRQLTSVR